MSKPEEGIAVAFWPDGVWVVVEEASDFEELLLCKSDDYRVVQVTRWGEDGSPHRSILNE